MNQSAIDWSRVLPLLLPLVVLQLALLVIALRDLSRRASTRGPKWLWVLVILFVNILGPILYFALGRREE